MKEGFKKISFLEEWFAFIRQNYIHIIFITLFYSLEICSAYISNYDLSLHRFSGRMIGVATLDGIDIGRRTMLFYSSVGLFILVNAVLYSIAFIVAVRRQPVLKKLVIFNVSSLIGCLLVFLKTLNFCNENDIHLIILIHITAIVFWGVRKILLNNFLEKLFAPSLFSMVICISVCLLFFIKECNSLFKFNYNISFSLLILLCCFLIFLSIAFYIRKFSYNKASLALIKLFWVLIPIMLIPLLSVLKNEIYLILNNKGIQWSTPTNLYFLFLLFILVWIYFRSRKQAEIFSQLDMYRVLSSYYFPLLVLGISTFIFYSPFMVVDSAEMFEQANLLLPVMEFFKFHTIPLLEKFNSHMLSEIITVYLYGIFNNFKGQGPLLYNFIFYITGSLTTYFIVRDFTRSAYVALFTVILFPLTSDLTANFFPALLAVYVLYRIIYFPPSFKNYLLLVCSCIFLIIWKIDTGVASVCAVVVTLVLYSIAKRVKLNYRFLFVALGCMLIIFLIAFFIFLAKGINIISNLLNQYSYLSSAQSYGYENLSYKTPGIVFQMQYFVFPVVALLLAGYIFIHFKKLSSSRNLQFSTLCLLFCICYYIANFQRGLVRHSFVENTDADLSVFIFFIISGSVYILCRYQSHIVKFLLFFFVSFLLLTSFKFPGYNPSVIYELFEASMNNLTPVSALPGASREIDIGNPENKFIEFNNFIEKELKDDETFIDFSNESMLYYYTQKITPSYFYQNPLSMHNDYLQKRFIENLSNYKVPLLLYSNFPVSDESPGFNGLDGVPNALRHYRIAEYLFQHYQPFVIIQNYCLWKSNKSKLEDTVIHLRTFKKGLYSIPLSDTAFQKIPLADITPQQNGIILVTVSYSKFPANDGISYCISKDTVKNKAEMIFQDDSTYKRYYIVKHSVGENLKFYIEHFADISELQMDEANYIPDFYSTFPRHWKIGMLPYIWANYDDKIRAAPVQKILDNKDTIINNSTVAFNLPDSIDKSTGNYIFISLEAANKNPATIQLSYGPSNGYMDFTLPPGEGQRKFAVRISSQYNWYAKKNKTISLYAPGNEIVHVKKISLLKGD